MQYALDIPISGVYADPSVLADLAADAEAAGWDGFFLWDVLLGSAQRAEPLVDPWVALAAIATRTRRLRIGAFMTALPRRRPWKVARETVSLDHLSHGRLIFGAGIGFDPREFAAFGEDADSKIRAEKLDEGLEMLTGLWTGEPFSFAGEHYRVDDVTFLPRPVQSPRIPIWIAGGWPNPRPFRRAARWDGLYLLARKATGELLAAADIRDVVAYVAAHRAPDAGPFEVAVPGETPSEREAAVEIVRPFEEAGATWWVEIEDAHGSFEGYRERIRHGPPRLC
jgi:alkanesulfonate monooxygenase SsuD/methylene tetrahydromethanopterin reductase-like flavin-dependent oxidoreductase (luciferase family)